VFWGLYWAFSAMAVVIAFTLGFLVVELLPYSTVLGQSLWIGAGLLLVASGYGALSILIAAEGKKKGYSRTLFFWLSIALTPVLVGIILGSLGTRKSTMAVLPRICISCQAPLLDDAIFCSECGQRHPIPAYRMQVSPPNQLVSGRHKTPVSDRNAAIALGTLASLGVLTLALWLLLASRWLEGTGGQASLRPQDLLSIGALAGGLIVLAVVLFLRAFRSR